MATKDAVTKFAEQSLQIERLLDKHDLNGDAGRVVIILAAANDRFGVTQKQVVEEISFPKDVVSKIVRSLVRAGLVRQSREGEDPRVKRLYTTDAGKSVVAEIKAALETSPPVRKIPAHKVRSGPMLSGLEGAE